ncbi:MAG: hypothetical protein MUE81_17860 [Thermoflexibacter sp.]|jgi:hypothetical protein|nr:hypothetical protein [Thermoflexibacter sp.]
MKKLFLCYLFLLFACFTCEKSAEIVPNIIFIKGGSSFGMCIGHCITELEISDQTAIMHRKAWRSKIADKTCQRAISSTEWQTLVSKVNFAKMKNLPEVIGCPDCADGGKEWIEIVYGEQVKRVTFEFGKEVPEIQDLINEVRKIREGMNDCE